MTRDMILRDVGKDDLAIFFEQQSDPETNTMAAFTAKDPTDPEAFNAHWNRILGDDTVIIKTIVFDGQIAGSVLSYEEDGKPEVSRVARDNLGSRRVLEKCGFIPIGEARGFANARGVEIDELLLELKADGDEL